MNGNNNSMLPLILAMTGSGGGGEEPIIINVESNTTINGYQVPLLTSENIQAIYNGIVAGKEVVVVDATENMHFKVNQADTDTDDLFISFIYYDIMILQYDTLGNITFKEIPQPGTYTYIFEKSDLTDSVKRQNVLTNINNICTNYINNHKHYNLIMIENEFGGIFYTNLTLFKSGNNGYILSDLSYKVNDEGSGIYCHNVYNFGLTGSWGSFRNITLTTFASWTGSREIPLSYQTTTSGVNGALTTDNTKAYTPTSDYHPATKKYVDDAIREALQNINTGGE